MRHWARQRTLTSFYHLQNTVRLKPGFPGKIIVGVLANTHLKPSWCVVPCDLSKNNLKIMSPCICRFLSPSKQLITVISEENGC